MTDARLEDAIDKLLQERNRIAEEVAILVEVRAVECDPTIVQQLLLNLVPGLAIIARMACQLDPGEVQTRIDAYSNLVEAIERLAADAARVDASDAQAVADYLDAVEDVTAAVSDDTVSEGTAVVVEQTRRIREGTKTLAEQFGEALSSFLDALKWVAGGAVLLLVLTRR